MSLQANELTEAFLTLKIYWYSRCLTHALYSHLHQEQPNELVQQTAVVLLYLDIMRFHFIPSSKFKSKPLHYMDLLSKQKQSNASQAISLRVELWCLRLFWQQTIHFTITQKCLTLDLDLLHTALHKSNLTSAFKAQTLSSASRPEISQLLEHPTEASSECSLITMASL